MSAQHTPGRLTTDEADHDEPYQDIKIKAGEHHTVCTVWIDDAPVRDFNAMQRENARRLVACWNSCEGAPTEWLEQNKPVKELADAIRYAQAQRDELLAALEVVADTFGEDWLEGSTQRRLGDMARAAIAKVEGGAA